MQRLVEPVRIGIGTEGQRKAVPRPVHTADVHVGPRRHQQAHGRRVAELLGGVQGGGAHPALRVGGGGVCREQGGQAEVVTGLDEGLGGSEVHTSP